MFTALVAAGCSQAASTTAASPGSSGRVLVASSGVLTVVDGSTGLSIGSVEMGLISADGSRVYHRTAEEVVARDLAGQVQARTTVPAGYAFPKISSFGEAGGLSPNGRYLALAAFDSNGDRVARSHFLVFDTANLGAAPRRADLAGNFQFDALSDDGNRLYILEYPDATGAGTYRVRYWALDENKLDTWVIVDKSKWNEPMVGERVASIPSKAGSFLYSVYAHAGGAFIHELPLSAGDQFALCIDLPGATSDPAVNHAWGIAADPSQSHLFAANALTRAVVILDPGSGRVMQALRLAQPPARTGLISTALAREDQPGPSLVLARGRLYVPAFGGIAIVDAAGMNQVGYITGSGPVTDLAGSPDGRWIWALTRGGNLLRIDAATGATVAEVRVKIGAQRLLRVVH